jgi:restriction endonuclease S subunit
MKAHTHTGVEYSEVSLSELGQEMRFDADYWEPSYLRNEEIIKSKKHSLTKDFAPNPQYGISVAMNEEGIGYSILKMDNIMEMLAEDKDAKFAEVSAKTFDQFKLKKFDVLFNRVNSDEFVGRTGIYLMDGEHTFASYLVRVDSGKPHTNCYLATFLNTKYGKTALQRVKRRAVNQANINAKELSNLYIPIPSEVLQKEIQTLMLKAQKNKVLSDNLYAQAGEELLSVLGLNEWKPKTIKFKSYGIAFEIDYSFSNITLSDVLSNDRLDSEFWDFKYLELQNILSGQKNISIGDPNYFSILTGIYSNQYTTETGKYYLRSVDISDQLLIDPKALYRTPNKFNQKFEVYEGDILTSRVGSIGTVGYVTSEFNGSIVSDNTLRIRLNPEQNELLPLYCAFYLSSVGVHFMKRLSRGSVQQRLNQSTLKAINVPSVSMNIQKKIERLLNKSFEAKGKSKRNLSISVKAIEIFIEKDDKEALKYIKQNTK